MRSAAVDQVFQDLPQADRRPIQRLKLESRHLAQLCRIKSVAQVMLTQLDLLRQMEPEDAAVFHLQVEMMEIRTKLQQVKDEIENQEATALNTVVGVTTNLLKLHTDDEDVPPRPTLFFRPAVFCF